MLLDSDVEGFYRACFLHLKQDFKQYILDIPRLRKMRWWHSREYFPPSYGIMVTYSGKPRTQDRTLLRGMPL